MVKQHRKFCFSLEIEFNFLVEQILLAATRSLSLSLSASSEKLANLDEMINLPKLVQVGASNLKMNEKMNQANLAGASERAFVKALANAQQAISRLQNSHVSN